MSRRTRLKNVKSRVRFGRSHHNDYSTSDSSFLEIFSKSGLEVVFPCSVCPFIRGECIYFVGDIKELMAREEEAPIDYNAISTVNISLKGRVLREPHIILNTSILYASLACFCLLNVFKWSQFRRRCFVQYGFEAYAELSQFVRRMGKIKTIVINIQDNFLTPEKVRCLDQAFLESDITSITIRNMSYHITVPNEVNLFQLIRAKKKVEFKFIWEDLLLTIPGLPSKKAPEEEEISLVDDIR